VYNPASAVCAGTFLPRSYLNYQCKPAEGLLVLFPAFLLHETAVSNSVKSRISFAFDVRLTADPPKF
jgi:hypothetical protein